MESSTFLLWLWCWWHCQLRLLPDIISFSSRCKDSAEKYIPKKISPSDVGSDKEHALISSPVTSLGNTTPWTFFSYLQNTVNLKPPPPPCYPVDKALHWGVCLCVCAWQGEIKSSRAKQRHSKRRGKDSECLKGTQPERLARQALRTRRREEQSRRDQLGVLLPTDTQACSQAREKGRRAGEGREEGERQRKALLGCLVLLDLSEGHRHTGVF